ncbi:DUF4166 domain-containing protein [Novosphingobium sp.]|uniref:DUF4166 domain-containing protein n=1 Tax=Novosphingobium sp. TaxID=1874826 RepID=UPI002636D6D4|nr:DUF4166 domain-containing protein [Novosphingobium sp.]
MIEPLFRRLLGDDLDRLPPALRRAHDARDRQVWAGTAQVVASRNPLARALCRMMGLPRAGRDVPVTVVFERAGEAEIWRRNFAGRRYHSRFLVRDGLIVEQMGPATNRFRAHVEDGELHLELVGFRFFGVPFPAWLSPRCPAVESEVAGCYRFDVPIVLPFMGLAIRYTGVMEACDG